MTTPAAWILLAWLAPRAASPAVTRAEDAWADGRYAEAAEAYAVAYAESGDIAYLFARGEAQRAAGDCVGATSTFEAFIATEPLQQAVEAARAAIEACRAQLPPPPPPAAEPKPAPPPAVEAAPSPAETAPRDAPPSTSWRRDPTAASLVGVGAASSIAGVTLAVVARTEQAEADRAADVVAFGEHNDRAVAFSRTSIPLLAIGGALVIGGVIRYVVLARRARSGGGRGQVGMKWIGARWIGVHSIGVPWSRGAETPRRTW